MALRSIILGNDAALYKQSRKIEKFDKRLAMLVEDMLETVLDARGAGLAAPQVGILRRVIVVLGEDGNFFEVVNPQIVEKKGKIEGIEGCLSFPDEFGVVSRPAYVKVTGFDRVGSPKTYKAEGMLAREFCHEIDHLDGVVFKDRATKMVEAE